MLTILKWSYRINKIESNMGRRVKLIRHWSDGNQTTATLLVVNDNCQPVYASVSIERGNRANEKRVSRVPKGTYPLHWEYSSRFKTNLWELKNVPNRSECKIHSANFWDQLNGCISPGIKLKDLDNDGYFDVTNSRAALKDFNYALKDFSKTTIEIIDEV